MLKGDLRTSLTWGMRLLAGCGASALVFASSAAVAQSVPTSGPAENGQPEWFIYQAPARAPGGPGGPAALAALAVPPASPRARPRRSRHAPQTPPGSASRAEPTATS